MCNSEDIALIGIKHHLPGVLPLCESIKIFLQPGCILITSYFCEQDAVVCKIALHYMTGIPVSR